MNDIGPGDIVVCVDASNLPDMPSLVEDWRYRIRWAGLGHYRGKLPWGVRLHGVSGPISEGLERAYLASRFRPLRKSDSEIFRKMIRLPEKETA